MQLIVMTETITTIRRRTLSVVRVLSAIELLSALSLSFVLNGMYHLVSVGGLALEVLYVMYLVQVETSTSLLSRTKTLIVLWSLSVVNEKLNIMIAKIKKA